MSISSILIFILGGFVGAELAFHFIYSPKAQIKSLRKQIKKITRLSPDFADTDFFDKIILEKKNKIKFLLDYNFDPVEDEEFIRDNTLNI